MYVSMKISLFRVGLNRKFFVTVSFNANFFKSFIK